MRLLAAILVLAASAAAQDFRAAVSGLVTDKTGAAIPNARVNAIRSGSNAGVEARTNRDGFYTLPFLSPGAYTFEVSAEGFQKLRSTGIQLMVADKIDLPFVLEVGNIAQEITVFADQELLRTGDASGGTNFDSLQTSEYALNGRQVYMLMDLAPGVLFTQEQFGASGFSGTRGWDTNGSYVMNGGVQGANQFLLNGAPISLTGSWQISPNVEAIQEFKVMTNTYDARYGRTGGGTVNTTLKSGANSWHGSVFDYVRNSILDANVTQNNRVGAPRGKHITHQFGGTIGGRLQPDHDFVFFSFEGFRERVPFPVVRDTAPMDLRDGQGFSRYRTNIYDPLTTRTCVPGVDTASPRTACSGTYVRDPFPGNVLPQSRISPIGRGILSLWPEPNYIGETQNLIAASNVGRYRYDQPMGKWDHIFSAKDRLTVTVSYQHGYEWRNQNGFPVPIDTGQIYSQRTTQHYILNWNHILTPTTIFDIRASFGRFTSYFPDGELENGFSPQDLGIRKMPRAPTSSRNLAPRINLDQYTSIIGNTYTWSTQNQWSITPTMTRVHGKHTTHIGGEFAYAGIGSGNIGRANGEMSFSRTWTQRFADRAGNRFDGSGIADLLLGLPGSGFIDWNDTFYRTWPYVAFFIQNDWKVSRTLTLNLGLRYDIQIPFVERHNRVNSGFDLNSVNPLSEEILTRWRELKASYDARNPQFPYPDPPSAIYGGKLFVDPSKGRRVYGSDFTNIQPRVGVAWLLMPRTVLRAGFGVYHRTATQNSQTDGFSRRTNYTKSDEEGDYTPRAGLTGPYSLEDPFPDGIAAPTGAQLGLLTNAGNAITFDGRQRPIPRTYQYSFGFQRRFPWSILIDASYAGSSTLHDSLPLQINYMSMGTFLEGQARPTYLNRNVPNPFYGIVPFTADFGNSPNIRAENLFRPYPLYNGITIATNPWARYRYDALQLRFERRFFGDRRKRGALTLIFSYTFSKSFEQNHRLNAWNLDENPVHQLTSADKPQNIAFSGVWDLPGRGHKYLGGWNFNWIYTFRSGYPAPKPNTLFSCESYIVPDQSINKWFNNDTSCYRSRPSYTLRDTEDRFANIRNMDAPALNITLARTFRFRERYSLQLRGEAFNLTNTPLFGAPDANFQSARFTMLPLEQRNFPRLVQVALKVLF
ncbi:MAG: carboxypeptidase regulatory-like domain-containing protein [Acidobacteria bacterium]|nr:carboxypeptidase regulatory-like domain-containing protein [Acidobacteriota bacterium]